MKENGHANHPNPSSLFTLMTGWMQQGVESFFATQRILVDLAMRQNLNLMKTLRDDFSNPEHSPVVMFTELAAEGTSTFIEAQKILLDLAHQQTDLVMGGIKERVTDSAPAMAMTEMVRRSLNTFIDMEREFLMTARKQADYWLHAVKAGKPYSSDHMIEMAREAMDHFVHAQKKFLDVIAEETNRATSGRPVPKMKKTELSKLAHEAATAFLEAQKKLLDVAGHQMNVNLKVAGRAMEFLKPLRLPIASLTGESVKGFVEAEKALIDNIVKHGRPTPTTTTHAKPRRKTAHAKTRKAMAAVAV